LLIIFYLVAAKCFFIFSAKCYCIWLCCSYLVRRRNFIP